jgi:HEAT repeat protein
MSDTISELLQSSDPRNNIEGIRSACRGKRIDLIPQLIPLLDSDEVSYAVEEGLFHFEKEQIAPPLHVVLNNDQASDKLRERVAGILAHYGDMEAIPLLLKAIQKPDVNQAYLNRLKALAPDELGNSLEAILLESYDLARSTTDDRIADYFAKIILVIRDLKRQQNMLPLLEGLLMGAAHWIVQSAAAEALHTWSPDTYRPMITEAARLSNRPMLLKLLERMEAN